MARLSPPLGLRDAFVRTFVEPRTLSHVFTPTRRFLMFDDRKRESLPRNNAKVIRLGAYRTFQPTSARSKFKVKFRRVDTQRSTSIRLHWNQSKLSIYRFVLREDVVSPAAALVQAFNDVLPAWRFGAEVETRVLTSGAINNGETKDVSNTLRNLCAALRNFTDAGQLDWRLSASRRRVWPPSVLLYCGIRLTPWDGNFCSREGPRLGRMFHFHGTTLSHDHHVVFKVNDNWKISRLSWLIDVASSFSVNKWNSGSKKYLKLNI